MLAHIRDRTYAWARRLAVDQAAHRVGLDPHAARITLRAPLTDFPFSVIVRVRDQRPYDDLAFLFTDRWHVAGSDGICG